MENILDLGIFYHEKFPPGGSASKMSGSCRVLGGDTMGDDIIML